MASIAKRLGPRGTRYLTRVRVVGVEVRRSFRKLTDARDFLGQIESDRLAGRSVDPRLGRQKFGTYARKWLETRPIRPTTRQDYESILRQHLEPTFGAMPLVKISPSSVRAWYEASLAAKVGRPRVAKAYRVLRAIFGTAVADELIARQPCRIRGAGEDRSPERPLAAVEDALAIVEAITDDLRAFVLLGSFCSLRLGELLGLRRRHIDILRRVVTIEGQFQEVKGGRIFLEPKTLAGVRRVAIPGVIMPAVDHHLSTFVAPDADALVFAGSTGAPLMRKGFYREWERACRAVGLDGLGLEDLHFHDLRHLGATLAARAGATTKELMARLGHSTPRAALIYQHAAERRDQEIAGRMGAMIQPPAEVVPLRNSAG